MRHARKTDPVSSHEAAAENAKRLARQVEEVARIVERYAPKVAKTTKEFAAKSGKDYHMLARRMIDAESAGRVERCERRVCTISGKALTTWRKA